MSSSLREEVKSAATWSIVLSALMMAAGFLALLVPSVTGIATALVFGWLLILSGILHVGYAWQGGRPAAVIWEVLLGVLYAGIGFYLLSRPVAGLEALTFALAAYLVFEGLLEFILAFFLRPLAASGWLLVDGVVTLALAMLIWTGWPASAAWAVGTLVAVSMFFSGMTRLMLATTVRRIVA